MSDVVYTSKVRIERKIGIDASNGKLFAEVTGEVEAEESVLVIRRIRVTMQLVALEEAHDTVERVHGIYAMRCPSDGFGRRRIRHPFSSVTRRHPAMALAVQISASPGAVEPVDVGRACSRSSAQRSVRRSAVFWDAPFSFRTIIDSSSDL
jgi:hypothetical protein